LEGSISITVKFAKRAKSFIFILISMTLASCADESRNQTAREELRNGLKVIRNLRSPAERPFRDLPGRKISSSAEKKRERMISSSGRPG
jgi:hypothetical protein